MYKNILSIVILFSLIVPSFVQANSIASVISVSDDNPIVEIAEHSEYLQDNSNTLRYKDIAQSPLPFQQHSKSSFKLSRKATLWCKFHISGIGNQDAQTITNHPLYLMFDNTILGSIKLYIPVIKNNATDTIELKGGWMEGAESSEIRFLYPTFVLPDNLDKSRAILLSISGPYDARFRATLLNGNAFREKISISILILGFCAGILVAMLLHNLLLYLYTRDKSYIYYVFYVFFLLTWQCILFGLFRFFWLSFGNLTSNYVLIFAAGATLFAALFAKTFLKTVKTAPRHDVVLQGIAVLAMVIILLCIFQFLGIGNNLVYLLAQISTVVIASAAIASLRSGFRPAFYYLIAISLLLIAAVIFFMRFYGLLPNNVFTRHAMLFGSSVESVLLSLALGYRFRLMRDEEQKLRMNQEKLQAISVTDELTQLFNRRYLNASLQQKIHETRRSNTPLSVLMMDVDHFKNFNDTYGHPEGDKVLSALSKLLVQVLRGEDIACRYGGEEFVTILHNTDKNTAFDIAERIRSGFEKTPFNPVGDKIIHVTISIGVAQLLPDDNPEQLLVRADQALYEAKKSGRNRICIS
ncbi:MAG: GGDEF domain-containing protein [Smithella sp.]|nr:GGDEF domain-containing protein [Smithella sp.]HQI73740.1 diguanylate cyclase [Smithella sp.]